MKKDFPYFFIFTLSVFFFFYLFNLTSLSSFIHVVLTLLLAIPLASIGITLFYLTPSQPPPQNYFLGKILILMSAALCLGSFSNKRIHYDELSFYWGQPVVKVAIIEGEINSDSITTKNNYQSFTLKLTHIFNKDASIKTQARGNVRIMVKSKISYFMGEHLIIHNQPIQTKESSWIIFTDEKSIIRDNPKFLPFYWRIKILKTIISTIDQFFGKSGPLFKALFLGIKKELPKNLLQGFQDSGTLHLLALSGLHVSIIYVVILLLCKLIPVKSLQFILSSTAILFYLFLVGPRPSLFRASIMIILFALGTTLKKESHRLNILALSALIVLILNPSDSLSLSFMFSFTAILGIIIFSPYFNFLLSKYLPNVLSLPLAVSLSAQWMVSPLLVYNFSCFNTLAIFYSLILTPLISIILWIGIIMLTVFPLLPEAVFHFFGNINQILVIVINGLLYPENVLNLKVCPPAILYIVIYGLVTVFLLNKRYRIIKMKKHSISSLFKK